MLSLFDDDNLPLVSGTTDDVGTVELEGVPPGRLRVVARFADLPLARERVELESGGEIAVTLRVQKQTPINGIRMDGRLLYARSDEPVPDFRFRLWTQTDEVTEEMPWVVGTSGRFSTVVPAPGSYSVSEMYVDGVEADTFWEEIVIREGEDVVIRIAKRLPQSVLIIDRDTRRPLPGARALSANTAFPISDAEFGLPSAKARAGKVLRGDASGLIDLGEGAGSDRWFIIAPDHAWRFATVAYTGEDEPLVLELGPAGQLELAITRWDELEDPSIAIRSVNNASGPAQLAVTWKDGKTLVDGIPPGNYRVTVRRGDWFSQGQVYGQGTVEIVAEVTARLTIDADPGEIREKMPLRGVVRWTSEWGQQPESIEFEGAEEENSNVDETVRLEEETESGDFEFKTPPIPTGSYLVVVRPFQWRKRIEVTPGMAPIELVLGQPATVRVRVLDLASGAPIPDASVSFSCRIEGVNSWSSDDAPYDSANGVHVVRCGPGRLSVEASADGHVDADYGEGRGSFGPQVAPGEMREIELRLRRAARLTVAFHLNGKLYSHAAGSIGLSAEEVEDAPWSSLSTSFEGGTETFEDLAPGTYKVDPPELAGFEKIKAPEVELRPGEDRQVVIELKMTTQ